MKPFVLLSIDALDFIQLLTVERDLYKKFYVNPLYTPLGFSTGLHYVALSGNSQHKMRIWTLWKLNTYPGKMLQININKWVVMWALEKLIRKRYLPVLPPDLSPYFTFEDRFDPLRPHESKLPTLIDELINHGFKIKIIIVKTLIQDIEKIVNAIFKPGFDVIVLTYSELDTLGHMRGRLTVDIRQRISNILTLLKKLDERNIPFLLYSDHGMVPVVKAIDILKIISNIDYILGIDYMISIESTLVRLWYFNRNAREVGRILREKLDFYLQDVVNSENAYIYDVPIPSKEFGDEALVLKPGIILLPSFWLPTRAIPWKVPRGMHGYICKSGKGLNYHVCGSYISNVEQASSIYDIATKVKKVLGVT
ncbi:MAG: alkaline phosphatase family protein [Desulfurococcus sp.]|nr:alkaline phosphatase family protein [Desulfurococcus sp.]